MSLERVGKGGMRMGFGNGISNLEEDLDLKRTTLFRRMADQKIVASFSAYLALNAESTTASCS